MALSNLTIALYLGCPEYRFLLKWQFSFSFLFFELDKKLKVNIDRKSFTVLGKEIGPFKFLFSPYFAKVMRG